MPSLSNERIAYHNGEYLPESRVLLPFRDRGFLYGDAVFDTARTFAHRPFRLVEHVDRLYRSLRYLRIDPACRRPRCARSPSPWWRATCICWVHTTTIGRFSLDAALQALYPTISRPAS